MEESSTLDKFISVEKYKAYLRDLVEHVSKGYGENCASATVIRILLKALENAEFVEGLK